ncbi:PIN domain-like protein [Amylostereum chailletii]|nr:PIN domain-like protein [Amylostereum chailletii]
MSALGSASSQSVGSGSVRLWLVPRHRLPPVVHLPRPPVSPAHCCYGRRPASLRWSTIPSFPLLLYPPSPPSSLLRLLQRFCTRASRFKLLRNMTSTCNPSGFWAFLEPVAEPRSLFELTIEKGVGKDGKGQPAIIGVDANSWILRCKGDRAVPSCVPTWSRKAIHGRLFLRLAWLLRIPATPLFLFDSDQAPVASRDEDRTRWGDELVQEFIALLDAFGYAWFKTRGDAAAELGRLQRSGHIHLVLSDDASTLLFGATCVVRTPLDVAASDECSVLIYRSENMARLRICLQAMLYSAQNAESMRPGHLYFVEETPFLFFFLDRVHERALRWESIPAYRVDFDTVDLFAGVRSIIKDSGDTIDPGNDAPCTVWVPCVLLRMACPLRVGEMP